MQKITPNLWYDQEAREAANFYTSIFPHSKILHSSSISGTPSGDVDMLTVNLMGHEFMLISAGPVFHFTPAISFLVALSSKPTLNKLWDQLSERGEILMDIGKYPFSQLYGWTKDKYGLSWQLMYQPAKSIKASITPTLLFVGQVAGRSEEALKFYTKIFPDSQIRDIMRYEKGEDPEIPGTIKHGTFRLGDSWFAAMDSALEHKFSFNESISFIVRCQDQKEIDYYWGKLSAVKESEQCGWLKDKFGVSWQIVPTAMDKIMSSGNSAGITSVTEAFLQMKRFDIAALERAFAGKTS